MKPELHQVCMEMGYTLSDSLGYTKQTNKYEHKLYLYSSGFRLIGRLSNLIGAEPVYDTGIIIIDITPLQLRTMIDIFTLNWD